VADYQLLEVNPDYESILGIARAQAVGRLASEIPADIPATMQVMGEMR
jgi:hypothetical protein